MPEFEHFHDDEIQGHSLSKKKGTAKTLLALVQ